MIFWYASEIEFQPPFYPGEAIGGYNFLSVRIASRDINGPRTFDRM